VREKEDGAMKNTEKQIAGMKAQTYGVEVEGNGITRENAAKVAATYFGTGRYKNLRDGYCSWAAYDQQGREWKFSRDSSIHGPDDQKCELVTPILRYEDLEFFLELLRQLRHAGMRSSPDQGCGVHIHVGLKGLDGRDHNAQTLRNLANIMAAHESQIGRAIQIDEGRTGRYCRAVDPDFLKRLNNQKPQTMEALKKIWYEGNHAAWGQDRHYNESRYHMLNLHASFTKGTIEFRLFQFSNRSENSLGGIHGGKMKAYIQLCLAMSEQAKELKTASPIPQQTENEKYAMRCWLLRLGMIGDEFATARKHLTEKLSGNSAWRMAS
jgi:hypothetical protein